MYGCYSLNKTTQKVTGLALNFLFESTRWHMATGHQNHIEKTRKFITTGHHHHISKVKHNANSPK
jgi:hypothetical protein